MKSIVNNFNPKKYNSNQTQSSPPSRKITYWSPQHYRTSITSPILETSSDAFFQLMSSQDSNAFKAPTSCIYAVLMSMEQQLKWKPYRRRRHQRKCVITIIRSTQKYINGSTLASITSDAQALSGILKLPNKFSWVSIKMIRFTKNKWCNATAKTVIFG